MRKIKPSLLTTVILALSALLLSGSCSNINVNTQPQVSSNAIARVYIGLSSVKLQREIEIEEVEEILSIHFSASTLQQSTGFYKGKREKSLIITIINCCSWEQAEEMFRSKINKLVFQLRNDLGQESILFEYLSNGRTEVFEVKD